MSWNQTRVCSARVFGNCVICSQDWKKTSFLSVLFNMVFTKAKTSHLDSETFFHFLFVLHNDKKNKAVNTEFLSFRPLHQPKQCDRKSVSAIGVLGKLVLQVTDSLFL